MAVLHSFNTCKFVSASIRCHCTGASAFITDSVKGPDPILCWCFSTLLQCDTDMLNNAVCMYSVKGCYVMLCYYFMKEVTPSAEAGINGV